MKSLCLFWTISRWEKYKYACIGGISEETRGVQKFIVIDTTGGASKTIWRWLNKSCKVIKKKKKNDRNKSISIFFFVSEIWILVFK